MNALTHVLAGVAMGDCAGLVYLWMLQRSVRRVVRDRRVTRVLIGAPLRMAVPVATLVLLASWERMALVGAVCGLLAAQLAARLWPQRGES